MCVIVYRLFFVLIAASLALLFTYFAIPLQVLTVIHVVDVIVQTLCTCSNIYSQHGTLGRQEKSMSSRGPLCPEAAQDCCSKISKIFISTESSLYSPNDM